MSGTMLGGSSKDEETLCVGGDSDSKGIIAENTDGGQAHYVFCASGEPEPTAGCILEHRNSVGCADSEEISKGHVDVEQTVNEGEGDSAHELDEDLDNREKEVNADSIESEQTSSSTTGNNGTSASEWAFYLYEDKLDPIATNRHNLLRCRAHWVFSKRVKTLRGRVGQNRRVADDNMRTTIYNGMMDVLRLQRSFANEEIVPEQQSFVSLPTSTDPPFNPIDDEPSLTLWPSEH